MEYKLTIKGKNLLRATKELGEGAESIAVPIWAIRNVNNNVLMPKSWTEYAERLGLIKLIS